MTNPSSILNQPGFQMRRRASDHTVLQATSSVSSHHLNGGGDVLAYNGHRKASATPSLKSQRSIYSKVLTGSNCFIFVKSYCPRED